MLLYIQEAGFATRLHHAEIMKTPQTNHQPPRKLRKLSPELPKRCPYLPPEIISNILSRVPTVDSLLRCKCVCKSWNSLISDPIFIKTHLKFSLPVTAGDHHHHHHNLMTRTRFVFVSRTTLSIRSCSVQALLHDSSSAIKTLDIDNSLEGQHNWAQIVGSCNGLICVASLTHTLAVWNPSTKQSTQFAFRFPDTVHCSVVYGFGYDEPSDDHKTVMVYWSNQNGAFVRVHSLKTDSWRRIQDFPHGIPLQNSAKLVNGALHFACRGGNSSWIIVSLDLATETYGTVPQPDYGDGDYGLELGVLEGCLCVVCNLQGVHADIWVMKEYGAVGSWKKLISIPYLTDTGYIRYSNPLFVSNTKNGSEVLLQLGDRLVLYDSMNNTLKDVGAKNYDASPGVCTYVESLVSPNINNVSIVESL